MSIPILLLALFVWVLGYPTLCSLTGWPTPLPILLIYAGGIFVITTAILNRVWRA